MNIVKVDILLCGVGGQGVLSAASIITKAAMQAGFQARQSEVHGMAQRGGSVTAHLRISDKTIESDLIPRRSADLLLGLEPIESLRYLDYLAKDGIVVTSVDPVKNIPNYPAEEFYMAKIRALPEYVAIPAQKIALEAGSERAANMVMVGAVSNVIPIDEEYFKDAVKDEYASKGEKITGINLIAFELGREAKKL